MKTTLSKKSTAVAGGSVYPHSLVLPSRRGCIRVPWTDDCVDWPMSVGSHGYGQKTDLR